MANEPKTRQDLETALILKAWKDDAFRQELLSNPKAAIAQVTGKPLPDDVQVVVHQETSKTIHLVLPEKPAGRVATQLGELTEEQLRQVAGGMQNIKPLVSACIGTPMSSENLCK